MYAKIQITGDIEVKSGMHIGGISAFAAIGAVDSNVIKDTRTNLPMIPGSSLKGKMRSLLAKEFNTVIVQPDDDHDWITRLFGSAKKDNVRRSRVLISDMIMVNSRELHDMGLQSMIEVKFENAINRMTAVANPRQIERVVRGAIFEMDMIYEVENIEEGMRLLQYDYLGGNGSRGYGKIAFKNLHANTVVGHVDDDLIKECNHILQKVFES